MYVFTTHNAYQHIVSFPEKIMANVAKEHMTLKIFFQVHLKLKFIKINFNFNKLKCLLSRKSCFFFNQVGTANLIGTVSV